MAPGSMGSPSSWEALSGALAWAFAVGLLLIVGSHEMEWTWMGTEDVYWESW